MLEGIASRDLRVAAQRSGGRESSAADIANGNVPLASVPRLKIRSARNTVPFRELQVTALQINGCDTSPSSRRGLRKVTVKEKAVPGENPLSAKISPPPSHLLHLANVSHVPNNPTSDQQKQRYQRPRNLAESPYVASYWNGFTCVGCVYGGAGPSFSQRRGDVRPRARRCALLKYGGCILVVDLAPLYATICTRKPTLQFWKERAWPTRSPDLFPLGFFIAVSPEVSCVSAIQPAQSPEDIIARLAVINNTVDVPMPGRLQGACFTRAEKYVAMRGANFEHLSRPGFNPRPGHSGSSPVGIVPDDAVDRRVFSGSPHPSFRRCSMLTSITLIVNSSILRAVQIVWTGPLFASVEAEQTIFTNPSFRRQKRKLDKSVDMYYAPRPEFISGIQLRPSGKARAAGCISRESGVVLLHPGPAFLLVLDTRIERLDCQSRVCSSHSALVVPRVVLPWVWEDQFLWDTHHTNGKLEGCPYRALAVPRGIHLLVLEDQTLVGQHLRIGTIPSAAPLTQPHTSGIGVGGRAYSSAAVTGGFVTVATRGGRVERRAGPPIFREKIPQLVVLQNTWLDDVNTLASDVSTSQSWTFGVKEQDSNHGPLTGEITVLTVAPPCSTVRRSLEHVDYASLTCGTHDKACTLHLALHCLLVRAVAVSGGADNNRRLCDLRPSPRGQRVLALVLGSRCPSSVGRERRSLACPWLRRTHACLCSVCIVCDIYLLHAAFVRRLYVGRSLLLPRAICTDPPTNETPLPLNVVEIPSGRTQRWEITRNQVSSVGYPRSISEEVSCNLQRRAVLNFVGMPEPPRYFSRVAHSLFCAFVSLWPDDCRGELHDVGRNVLAALVREQRARYADATRGDRTVQEVTADLIATAEQFRGSVAPSVEARIIRYYLLFAGFIKKKKKRKGNRLQECPEDRTGDDCVSGRTSYVYKEGKSCKETCIAAEKDWAAMASNWGHDYLPNITGRGPGRQRPIGAKPVAPPLPLAGSNHCWSEAWVGFAPAAVTRGIAVQPFMDSKHHHNDGTFQQSNALCRRAQVVHRIGSSSILVCFDNCCGHLVRSMLSP
ncbi:hypothetical protein PR048_006908 [Dryococelus australis]|uniref:Uncharacterized protein n=1 Tax=Dryococelus australis TaxID=614101 RepID=A0ABQ9IEG1_9NEOP|nr:hypothetical protein PR048_006908 [Dryococelus australis]